LEKVAFVDLTSQQVKVKEIPEELERRYLGGAGINAYLLYNYLPPGVDPLSPENVLLFGSGLMTGHYDISTSRFEVSAKSPETGGHGRSNSGGFWGPELKFAGFQHLVITGRASQPTYLWIHDGEIEFRDASFLWGKDTYESQELILDDLGNPKVQVALIGQAGEKLVRFACIIHGLKRAAGRTGMGCVMGSKLLKAIAVRGTQGLKVQNPGAMARAFANHWKLVVSTKVYPIFSRYGTMTLYTTIAESGQMPTLNHQFNVFKKGEGILEEEYFDEKYKTKSLACYACPLHCEHRYRIPSGSSQGIWGHGPEYYYMSGFGACIGNANWDVILAANDLTNRYGLDCGSSSAYIAWLMELWQRGIITDKDTGGMNLEWGNKEAIIGLLHQMANNEGLGGTVGQKAAHAAKEIGKGADHYLYQNRGLIHESSVHAQACCAITLGESTSNRGSCHLRGRSLPEYFALPEGALSKFYGFPVASDFRSWKGKPRMAIWTQHLHTIVDALGICKIATVSLGSLRSPSFKEFCESIRAIKGWDMNIDDLMEIAERIWNLEAMFNIKEKGARREDNRPPRFYYEPNKLEPLKGEKIDWDEYEQALDEYFEIRGWNRDGSPKHETLQRLGLDTEPSHKL
jgi:aldehyde:ferredoxin oxidoreductase